MRPGILILLLLAGAAVCGGIPFIGGGAGLAISPERVSLIEGDTATLRARDQRPGA